MPTPPPLQRYWMITLFLSLAAHLTLASGEERINDAESEDPTLMQAVVVDGIASMQESDRVAQPSLTLSGDELRTKAANSLGATLQNESGIMNQSFGPGVGVPVIRGQTGPRVRIMQDSIGNNDVSTLSPDHANAIEPTQAESIEVLRGPASLLYGSGAIGGIVNVIDNRVPTKAIANGFKADLEQRFNSVSNETASFAKAEASQDHMAYHMDGYFRDSGNLSIGGKSIDANAAIKNNPGLYRDGLINNQGFIPNSSTQAKGGSFGFSVLGEPGYAGGSINYYENNYGIPPDGVPNGETVRIDMHQTRGDIRSELEQPLPGIARITSKLAYTDYAHTEYADGLTGTQFSNKTTEGRIEIRHDPMGPLNGLVGLQAYGSEINSFGDEAIIPRTWTNAWGGFGLETYNWENLVNEWGVRLEHVAIKPDNTSGNDYAPVSLSGNSRYNITREHAVSIGYSRNQRSPQAQELYANGLHPATFSYEQGDSSLTLETTYNLEASYHLQHELARGNMTIYQTWARDYIYNSPTGLEYDPVTASIGSVCQNPTACIPVYQIAQQNAGFRGFEAKMTSTLHESGYGLVELTLFGDYTRGMFSGGAGNVPRMPPLRYGFQIDHIKGKLNTNVRLTRGEAQKDAAEHDTTTPGWLLLNLGAQYTIEQYKEADVMLFAQANNLLDQNIRNAVSYLRNFAPESGRGVLVGIKASF